LSLEGYNEHIYKMLAEADELKFTEPQKSMERSYNAYVSSLKSADRKAEAYSLYLMGVCSELLTNYPDAMKYLSECIKLSAAIGDKKKMADGLNTIGIIHDNLGNYANALKTYFRCLKIYDELDQPRNKAIVLSNIGLVYTNINDYQHALQFYSGANELAIKLNDNESLLVTYINIGLTYRLLKEYENAESHLLKALEIAKSTNDKLRESLALQELGDVEVSLGNIAKGYEHYKRSLELKYDLNDRKGIANILAVIGQLQLFEDKLVDSKKNLLASLVISEDLGFKKLSSEIHKMLSEIYEKENNPAQALEHYKTSHEKEIEYLNEETAHKAKNIAIQHEVEKAQKEAEIQKLRNVELAKALEDVEVLNENLKELNEEKNEFMAIAVHDLKNPLQNILSTARVLKNTKEPDSNIIADFTSNIISQTDRMFNLIKKLLDHNAIEQGNIKIRKTTFKANGVCNDVINNMRENAAKKNIYLYFEDNSGDISIYTDYDILFQILDNLVSNSIKFSSPYKNIYLKIHTSGDKVFFEVQDEGPGFTERDKTKVFTKFARLSAQPTGGEHSTGLGLSIVKKLTELLKGEVSFESEEGSGTTFTLSFEKINNS
jgi:signal transduction histidine kinase